MTIGIKLNGHPFTDESYEMWVLLDEILDIAEYNKEHIPINIEEAKGYDQKCLLYKEGQIVPKEVERLEELNILFKQELPRMGIVYFLNIQHFEIIEVIENS